MFKYKVIYFSGLGQAFAIWAVAAILFYTLNSFNFSGQYKFGRINDSLRGHVKTETYFYYESNKTGDAPDSNWNYKSVAKYSPNGKVESIYYFNSQNNVDSSMTMLFKYDAIGRDTFVTGLSGNVSNNTTYSLDRNGNEVKIDFFGAPSPGLKLISNKKALTDTLYSYDRGGGFMSKSVLRKNKNGDVVERIEYDTTGSMSRTQAYTYDDLHNKLTEITIDNKSQTHWHFYEYDKFGNEIFEKVLNDMYIGGWRVGESDPVNKDITYYRLKYSELDKYDNWQKEESLFKGKAVKKIIRKIEYYD